MKLRWKKKPPLLGFSDGGRDGFGVEGSLVGSIGDEGGSSITTGDGLEEPLSLGSTVMRTEVCKLQLVTMSERLGPIYGRLLLLEVP